MTSETASFHGKRKVKITTFRSDTRDQPEDIQFGDGRRR
jgi:hypothetical protein